MQISFSQHEMERYLVISMNLKILHLIIRNRKTLKYLKTSKFNKKAYIPNKCVEATKVAKIHNS